MIELFEQNRKKFDRQSSKGNQIKWENEGVWYKADYTGYEGLAEYMISQLLLKSSLKCDEFVLYDLEQIQYRSTIFNGVKCDDFLKPGWQLVTVERLFEQFFGKSLYLAIYHIADHEKRFDFLVEQMERITGLKDFDVYFNKMFTIDAFFLNEDRHTHNIAVLMSDQGEFAYCPYFDQGAGLLADTTMDYPMGEDVYETMKRAKAKTISGDFDEQLEISEKKCGVNLHFRFTKRDVDELLEQAVEYPKDMRERVKEILYLQMAKYQYLFRIK